MPDGQVYPSSSGYGELTGAVDWIRDTSTGSTLGETFVGTARRTFPALAAAWCMVRLGGLGYSTDVVQVESSLHSDCADVRDAQSAGALLLLLAFFVMMRTRTSE